MNAGTDGDREIVAGHGAKDPESLKGMPHNKVRLGIGFGDLMEVLHRWHLFAFLDFFKPSRMRINWPSTRWTGKDVTTIRNQSCARSSTFTAVLWKKFRRAS
jgi:hypothetical protein